MKISLQQCANRSAVLFPGRSFYFPLDGKNQLKWEYRKQSTMILWWFLHVSLIGFFVNFSLPNDLWMAYSEHIPYGKLCWLKKKKNKNTLILTNSCVLKVLDDFAFVSWWGDYVARGLQDCALPLSSVSGWLILAVRGPCGSENRG